MRPEHWLYTIPLRVRSLFRWAQADQSFALEGYRSGKLTEELVRRISGYGTRIQVDGFLKEHGVYMDYNLEDVDRESETSREFSSR